MKHSLSGSMLVFLGAVFWSLNAPLVKFLGLDPYMMCGLRAIIAGIALSPFIRPKQLNWNGWMVLYLLGYCALSLSIILALKMTSSPVAIGMQYTAVIWLFLVHWLTSRRFDMHSFAPVFVILVGVVFFMCSGTDGASTVGNLIALCEGVFFACMTMGAKKASGTNALGMTAVGSLFTGVVVLSLFPASTATITAMSMLDWTIMLILGVVQIGCGYALYNLGVQRVSPQKASVLALWEMILGPVWVMLFLKEYPSIPVVIGFVIILIGMLLDAGLGRSPAQKTSNDVRV